MMLNAEGELVYSSLDKIDRINIFLFCLDIGKATDLSGKLWVDLSYEQKILFSKCIDDLQILFERTARLLRCSGSTRETVSMVYKRYAIDVWEDSSFSDRQRIIESSPDMLLDNEEIRYLAGLTFSELAPIDQSDISSLINSEQRV